MKMNKRLASILLSLALVFSLVLSSGVASFAETESQSNETSKTVTDMSYDSDDEDYTYDDEFDDGDYYDDEDYYDLDTYGDIELDRYEFGYAEGKPVEVGSSHIHVTCNWEPLTYGVDYTISYENNIDIGKATIIATGIGKYSGSTSCHFKIAGKVTLSNKTYKSVSLKWTEIPDVDGYDVVRDIFMEDYFLKTTTSNSCKLTNLLPLQNYYIIVYPYKLENGTKEYLHSYDMEVTFSTPQCYDGIYYSSNKKASKSITKVLKTYKHDSLFKGRGECYGYAEWASNKIAKKRTYVKINKSLTLTNIKKYICNLKPGSHVRISHHSIVILKATKNTIYWADNNYNIGTGRNRVHYWAGSPEYFDRVYSAHPKLEYIYKTKTYR